MYAPSDGQAEQLYCKFNHTMGDIFDIPDLLPCGNPPYFKHSHNEYFYEFANGQSNDCNCLNRVDCKDSLFTKNLNTGKLQRRKLSVLLNHTKDHFVCGNITYEWDFYTLYYLAVREIFFLH